MSIPKQYFHRHVNTIKLLLVYCIYSQQKKKLNKKKWTGVWAPRLTVLTVGSGDARRAAAAGRTAAGAKVEALVHAVAADLSLAQTAVDLCNVARRAATRPRCNVTVI